MMDQLGLTYWIKYSKQNFEQVAGTQTAGLCFGGYAPIYYKATEEYNGSTWTAGPEV
jgi:hypothetical protein